MEENIQNSSKREMSTPTKLKFIDNSDIDQLTTFLTERSMGSVILNGKIETYSLENCRMKRMSKQLVAPSLSMSPAPSASTSTTASASISPSTSLSISSLQTCTVEEICSSVEAAVSNDLGTSLSDHFNSARQPLTNSKWKQTPITSSNTLNTKRQQSDPQDWSVGNRRQRSNSADFAPAPSRYHRKRSSSLSDLNEVSSRQLLLDIILTMNESFPDYDFTSTRLSQIVEKDVVSAMQVANGYLAELVSADSPRFLENLWKSVDEVINLRKCEVLSYLPDHDDDPFSSGAIWSFNYFFLNREINRICYFNCIASSKFGRRLNLTYSADGLQEYDQDAYNDTVSDTNLTDDEEREDERSRRMRAIAAQDGEEDSSDEFNDHPDWDGVI